MKLPSGIPESLAASVAQTWPVQCPVFCCCIYPSCPYAAGALWGPVLWLLLKQSHGCAGVSGFFTIFLLQCSKRWRTSRR